MREKIPIAMDPKTLTEDERSNTAQVVDRLAQNQYSHSPKNASASAVLHPLLSKPTDPLTKPKAGRTTSFSHASLSLGSVFLTACTTSSTYFTPPMT
jgi:hypothetical protein